MFIIVSSGKVTVIFKNNLILRYVIKIFLSFFILGYDDRTWEPSKNLDNCIEILKEYKLAVKSRRQQEEKNKKSPAAKGTSFINQNQRVVSVKNARTINYVKVD